MKFSATAQTSFAVSHCTWLQWRCRGFLCEISVWQRAQSVNKYRVSPAARGSGRSCRRWVDPPGWKRPRCLRSEGRCRWTRLCTGRSAHHLLAGWRSLSPSRRSSCRCCCNTGRAAMGRPPLCACRWRSSLAGWCRTSVWCRLSQTPCLREDTQDWFLFCLRIWPGAASGTTRPPLRHWCLLCKRQIC